MVRAKHEPDRHSRYSYRETAPATDLVAAALGVAKEVLGPDVYRTYSGTKLFVETRLDEGISRKRTWIQ